VKEYELYPRIRKEFPGITVRIDAPSRPGISDLVLVGKALTVFAEVKIAFRLVDKLAISPHQRRFIVDVAKAGGTACVLAYVQDLRQWRLLTSEVVDREWPTVRSAHGTQVTIASLETRILSTVPQNGLPFGAASSSGTVIAA
jgi:hypothetical protein